MASSGVGALPRNNEFARFFEHRFYLFPGINFVIHDQGAHHDGRVSRGIFTVTRVTSFGTQKMLTPESLPK